MSYCQHLLSWKDTQLPQLPYPFAHPARPQTFRKWPGDSTSRWAKVEPVELLRSAAEPIVSIDEHRWTLINEYVKNRLYDHLSSFTAWWTYWQPRPRMTESVSNAWKFAGRWIGGGVGGGRHRFADFGVPNGCWGGAKNIVNYSKNCFLGRIARSQVAAKSAFYPHESQILSFLLFRGRWT